MDSQVTSQVEEKHELLSETVRKFPCLYDQQFVHSLSLSLSSSSLYNERKLSQQSCTSTASHGNGEKRISLEIVNIRSIQTPLSHDNFFVGGNLPTIVTNIVLHAASCDNKLSYTNLSLRYDNKFIV